MADSRPSPAGRSLTRKERAEKAKDISERRAVKGLGPLVRRKTIDGVTYERREETGGYATGMPQVKTYKVVNGKRTKVANDSVKW